MYLYSDIGLMCTTFLDIGLQQLFRPFKFALIFVTLHKKQQLVHIVEIVLMDFYKRNMFPFPKFIYFRPYMPQ